MIVAAAAAEASQPPPSSADIALLRQAFAEFYGVNRDLSKALDLLSQTITKWQQSQQPNDEIAGLLRVRGDCYTLLGNAFKAYEDYNQAIVLLQTDSAKAVADPAELPAALLGRARAVKSSSLTQQQQTVDKLTQAAQDYELALQLSSREDWDTTEELLQDGATRNPYAAWEWGTILRQTNQWQRASYAHSLASNAFDEIGDKARSIISLLDVGIDLAATDKQENMDEAKTILRKAIAKTKGVEGRDVALLQKVIAKEGEGRMVLAALLWNEGKEQRNEAEAIRGEACIRLEQLQVDAAQRASNEKMKDASKSDPDAPTPLKFSIDDDIPSLGTSCFKFRDPVFVKETLKWPDNLAVKLEKLQSLK